MKIMNCWRVQFSGNTTDNVAVIDPIIDDTRIGNTLSIRKVRVRRLLTSRIVHQLFDGKRDQLIEIVE